MADLTPPSSQNNTPQRTLTADPPVSPTLSGPAPALPSHSSHPLSHTIPMDLDSATPTPAGPSQAGDDFASDSDTELDGDGEGGAGRRRDHVAELSGGEGNLLDSDGEMDVEDEIEQFGEGGKDRDDSDTDMKKGNAGFFAGVSGARQQLMKNFQGSSLGNRQRRTNKRGGPRRNQSGNSKPSRTNSGNLDFAGGSSSGFGSAQNRRDGLYETEIVSRWNADFGDVLAERTTTSAPAPTSTKA
ncbi:hypothetical protein IAT38_004548 [Cryptococcus sp. DSM 104549]